MSKKIFVFIHGLFAGPEQFSELYKNLDESYLAITLPGHFNSPFLHETWVDYSRTLAQQLKDQSKEIYLVGYSMGGRVCLSLIDHIKPKALFLIAPNPGLNSPEEKSRRLKKDQTLIGDNDLCDFLKKWYRSDLFALSDDQQSKLIKINSCHDKDQIKRSLDFFSLGRQDNYLNKIINQELEIYYLYGEYDQNYKKIAKTLGDSVKVHEIKKSGHNPLIQNIDQVKKIFKNFSQT